MSSVMVAFGVTLGVLLGSVAVATWRRPRGSVAAWWLVSSPVAWIAGLRMIGSVDPIERPGAAVAFAGVCVAIVLSVYAVLSWRQPRYLVLVAVPLAAFVAPIIALGAFERHGSDSLDAWGLGALMYLGWTLLLSIVSVVLFAAAYGLRLTDETEAALARDE